MVVYNVYLNAKKTQMMTKKPQMKLQMKCK